MLEAMPNSAELTGWLAYLRVDDEVQTQRTAYAIAKAFGTTGDQKVHAHNDMPAVVEEEPIIDTTDPEFVKHFQGFTYGDKPKNVPNRLPQTEIKIG